MQLFWFQQHMFSCFCRLCVSIDVCPASIHLFLKGIIWHLTGFLKIWLSSVKLIDLLFLHFSFSFEIYGNWECFKFCLDSFFYMFCLIWWWKLSSYSHVSKYTFYSTAKTKIGLWSYINILCLSINFNIKISLSLISFLLLCCQWVWSLLIYCFYSHEHYWSKKCLQ